RLGRSEERSWATAPRPTLGARQGEAHLKYLLGVPAFPVVARNYRPNRSAARALALAASSSRFFGGAFVSSAPRSSIEIAAMPSTAARNRASLAFDGLLNPVIFRTNWSAAARVSSSVTGGSKLNSVLMFLHMQFDLTFHNLDSPWAPIGSPDLVAHVRSASFV